MIYNQYKLTWTFAFFHHSHSNPKDWQKFKKKYEKTFKLNNKITNNSYTAWCFDKNRIEWIKKEIPENSHVNFLQVTDKQLGDVESFYQYSHKKDK